MCDLQKKGEPSKYSAPVKKTISKGDPIKNPCKRIQRRGKFLWTIYSEEKKNREQSFFLLIFSSDLKHKLGPCSLFWHRVNEANKFVRKLFFLAILKVKSSNFNSFYFYIEFTLFDCDNKIWTYHIRVWLDAIKDTVYEIFLFHSNFFFSISFYFVSPLTF